MDGRILGILGGMGPLATQLFYGMVIAKTDAHCDQEHINMIIVNHATMPDRTGAILAGNGDAVLGKLSADAQFLENSGAAVIAIPCNTSHYFFDRLQAAVSVPILHMIRETAQAAADRCGGPAKVGILATDGTIRTGLYQKELEAAGMLPVIPSAEAQQTVMGVIYDGIKKGEAPDYAGFQKVEWELAKAGCETALLACTELSCFRSMAGLSDFYLDAMDILAEKAVLACGKPLKK